MEVSIVSDEFIMPSPGTPKHLETHLMSFMDQLAPSNHVPGLLFYSLGVNAATPDLQIHVDDLIKKRIESLKQSLSKTLASFYPLAGRLSEDKNSIICSDQGLYFVEASVKANLSNFLQTPELFHKLVPAAGSKDNIVALVQVTRFTCGGMAIAVSISHKIADASSFCFFLRSWEATANDNRESYQISAPSFDGSTLYPPTETCPDILAMMAPCWKRGRPVTKRFVFDAEAIVALKAKASSSTCKWSPTRVEAVSALICKSIAAAMKARSGKPKPIYTTHAVNIRGKAMPSLPESCIGNYVGVALVRWGIVDQDTELPDYVIKMREEITETYNSEFVKNLQSEPTKYLESLRGISEVGDDVEYIGFNSWCNSGLYDIDFGWGKPMLITSPSVSGDLFADVYSNAVTLMDTRYKDGSVEAWITLEEEEIGILEEDKEFIAFTAFHLKSSL